MAPILCIYRFFSDACEEWILRIVNEWMSSFHSFTELSAIWPETTKLWWTALEKCRRSSINHPAMQLIKNQILFTGWRCRRFDSLTLSWLRATCQLLFLVKLPSFVLHADLSDDNKLKTSRLCHLPNRFIGGIMNHLLATRVDSSINTKWHEYKESDVRQLGISVN